MPENRRTPQDALVTTAGHPNDQYERLEKLLYHSVLMFILVYLDIFNICNGKLSLCLKTAGQYSKDHRTPK